MKTTPNKSRRRTVVVLTLIGILGLLCVIWMRHNQNQAIADTSISSPSFRAQPSDDSTSAPVIPPRSIDPPAQLSSATADAPEAPSHEVSRNGLRLLTSRRPPPADAMVASGLSPTAFGVVDLECLIAALPVGEDSPVSRARILRDIKRIVALRAAAHGFEFVFDISAKSARETPLILATNGVPDITAEVLQDLSQ